MIKCLKVPDRSNEDFWNYYESGEYKNDEKKMGNPIKASILTLREHAKMSLKLVNNEPLMHHTPDFMYLINWHKLHVYS